MAPLPALPGVSDGRVIGLRALHDDGGRTSLGTLRGSHRLHIWDQRKNRPPFGGRFSYRASQNGAC
jgi:hypothetical protein